MNPAVTGRLSPAAKALRLPLHAIPADTRVRILSGPLRGKEWIVGSSTHGCWLGTYERTKLELFRAALFPGAIVYDVGAHVGLYSLLAAAHIGPIGRVYAFEPLPRNLGYLRRHLALNQVGNCSVLDVAVSRGAGSAAFDQSVHPAMGHLGDGHGPGISVRTAALDQLLADGTTRPPAIIKIDIEGGEVDCLHGAISILTQWRPVIFLATHGPDVHDRSCRLLGDLAFDLHPIDGKTVAEARELVALPRS